MTALEWLGGAVSICTLAGFAFAQWRDGRAVKQAILGYEGTGGMMSDLHAVRGSMEQMQRQLDDLDARVRILEIITKARP